jgi:beta-lactamase superfamily II metal-dependent hydrolase
MKRIFSLFIVFTVLLLTACNTPIDNTSLSIDVLNVGKADCIVIRHNGETVLIDTAEKENLPEVMAFLQKNKIQTIHTMILSHFDKDHIGGAEGILKATSVERVIESNFKSDRGEYYIYHGVLREQEKEPLQLTEPFSFSVGECEFQVLPPNESSYERKEDNNASLIVTLNFRGKHFAFFGDAMEERIEEFISSNNQKFDFAKLPYHGNDLKNYPELIENIGKPKSVITCSHKNPASNETLSLLAENDISYYLTQNGNVSITCDGTKIKITQ